MNTFEIRHRYFFTNVYYFVETELCFEDFNWLMAYIQIIHCQECPSYQPQCEVEDCIWPDNGIHIIHRLYGFKVWAEAEPKIGLPILDLYTNWKDYCCRLYDAKLLNRFSVAHAEYLMLECSKLLLLAQHKDTSQLEIALKGVPVKPEWGWKTVLHRELTGKLYLQTGQHTLVNL